MTLGVVGDEDGDGEVERAWIVGASYAMSQMSERLRS